MCMYFLNNYSTSALHLYPVHVLYRYFVTFNTLRIYWERLGLRNHTGYSIIKWHKIGIVSNYI